MSWSYSGDPDSSPKDLVRFLTGDTDDCEKLLSDEEIHHFLKRFNNGALMSAMRCCEAIAAKFSRRVSEAAGPVKIEFQQAAEGYRKMALDLRRRMAIETSTPYAGGISVTDKQNQAQNIDRVKPDFTKQMMDNTAISPFTSIGQDTDPLQDPNAV